MKPTQSKARSTLGEPRVEFGRILNIYPERGTVDFRSEMSEQYRNDIPYTMPYFDQVEGTGITFNPEPGSTAICCTTSDGRSFILAFIGVDEDGGYLSGRPRGNPGDISITGRDSNFMTIRRGGIVQIGSKPICQTVYLPVRNILQHFCENFELYSLAGDMKFTVERPEDSSEGHSKCSYTMTVKEFADDDKDKPVFYLKAGSQTEKDIFTLVTRDKGGGNIKISLVFDKDGNYRLSIGKDMTLKVKGKVSIKSEDTTEIGSKGAATISSDQGMTVKGNTLTLKSNTTAELQASGQVTIKGATINLSNGAQFPIMRQSPDMQVWINAVSAMAKVPPPQVYFNPVVKA